MTQIYDILLVLVGIALLASLITHLVSTLVGLTISLIAIGLVGYALFGTGLGH